MARPMMKLGEWGHIALTAQVLGKDGKFHTAPDGARKADRYRARAKVRDMDGKVRDVERYAATKAAARRVLEEALRERVTPAAADAAIRPGSLVKDAAEVWRSDVLTTSDRLSTNTKKVYGSTLNLHVVSGGLANLTVREVKVASVERALTEIATASGPGAAKLARSVLRAVLDLAVKHDAIPLNPVRSVGHVNVPRQAEGKRDRRRAFTREERDAVLAFADGDPIAQRRDLPDLLAFMAGTGARIGEACGLRWADLDLGTGTAKLGALPVRVPGEGLRIQEHGKTEGSTRTVRLPSWLVARLLARQVAAEGNAWDVVFPSALGKLRDTTNTTKHVRALLDAAGFGWATGHTFRKSVATFLDAAGVSGRETANQLGHKRPSMTMDVYMDRTTVTEQAATVL
jgi:integrase